MLEYLRPLGTSLAQFFDPPHQEGGKSRVASEVEEAEPLDPNHDGVPLQGSEDDSMGRSFDDTYEKPEVTGGDALAQVVAIVSL